MARDCPMSYKAGRENAFSYLRSLLEDPSPSYDETRIMYGLAPPEGLGDPVKDNLWICCLGTSSCSTRKEKTSSSLSTPQSLKRSKQPHVLIPLRPRDCEYLTSMGFHLSSVPDKRIKYFACAKHFGLEDWVPSSKKSQSRSDFIQAWVGLEGLSNRYFLRCLDRKQKSHRVGLQLEERWVTLLTSFDGTLIKNPVVIDVFSRIRKNRKQANSTRRFKERNSLSTTTSVR